MHNMIENKRLNWSGRALLAGVALASVGLSACSASSDTTDTATKSTIDKIDVRIVRLKPDGPKFLVSRYSTSGQMFLNGAVVYMRKQGCNIEDIVPISEVSEVVIVGNPKDCLPDFK